ncbi:hypothetical protein GCM10027447_12490 [Glycomyces halotolerans]
MAHEDLAAELARTIAALVADAEHRLLTALSRQVRQDIIEQHTNLAAAYALIRQRTDTVLARLASDTTGEAARALLTAWATGANDAVDELDRLGSDRRRDWLARRSTIVRAINRLLGITRRREMRLAEELTDLRAALPGIDAVMAMAGELTQRMSSTHLHVLRWQNDAYRQAVTNPTVSVLAGTQTRLQAAQVMWDDLTAQGITGFTDRSGRNWELASYTEMSTRTAAAHALIEGHLDQLRRAGHDLVMVSDSPEECTRCRPWEGEILAIAGPAGPRRVEHGIEDGQMVTVDVRATLGQAMLAGLHHPNCIHREVLYIPGLTRRPQNTANPQGYEDRQRLRAIEREIRKAKRSEAAALTEGARRARARQVRAWQQRARELVASTDQPRSPEREQITGAR